MWFLTNLFQKGINIFRRYLQREVHRIILNKPMIVGPPDRLHISDFAVENNFLANTNSGNIYINDYVFFGKNCCLITGTHDFSKVDIERISSSPKEGRDIRINQGAWLATNVTVIGPCIIGEHSVVAAGSVVTKDVEPFTVVAGVPAKVVKKIEPKK